MTKTAVLLTLILPACSPSVIPSGAGGQGGAPALTTSASGEPSCEHTNTAQGACGMGKCVDDFNCPAGYFCGRPCYDFDEGCMRLECGPLLVVGDPCDRDTECEWCCKGGKCETEVTCAKDAG